MVNLVKFVTSEKYLLKILTVSLDSTLLKIIQKTVGKFWNVEQIYTHVHTNIYLLYTYL